MYRLEITRLIDGRPWTDVVDLDTGLSETVPLEDAQALWAAGALLVPGDPEQAGE